MTAGTEFNRKSKEDQLNYLEEYLTGLIKKSDFENAASLKECMIKYQKREFNFDDMADLKIYMQMLKIISF
jgi:hypothetical protein